MRPNTGLSQDLQHRYAKATKDVLPAHLHRRFFGDKAAGWAHHYAQLEPSLEDALGVCWNYSDREIVWATIYLLTGLAGPDLVDPERQRLALAVWFRRVADLIDSEGRK